MPGEGVSRGSSEGERMQWLAQGVQLRSHCAGAVRGEEGGVSARCNGKGYSCTCRCARAGVL